MRIRRGGEVLAPGAPTDPVQIIDARDLSEWVIRCCESQTYGVYNAEPEERKAKLRAGLDPAREKEVLAAWHAKNKKA